MPIRVYSGNMKPQYTAYERIVRFFITCFKWTLFLIFIAIIWEFVSALFAEVGIVIGIVILLFLWKK